jgi:DNA-binding NarL/FixJ family response regulator
VDKVRVFLIGARTMCVEGLAAILGTFDEVEIVGRAFEWTDASSRLTALDPDVVIVDLAHCAECGPETPLAAIGALQHPRVVVLSARGAGPTVVDALEAGALGYLTVDAVNLESIRTTVLAAARGEAAFDPKLSTAVLSRMRSLSRKAGSSGPRDVSPTEREAEVLELLVKGWTNRQIASALNVSESTVKNHLHAIYSKLGAGSRSQAVSEAIRRGLVEP